MRDLTLERLFEFVSLGEQRGSGGYQTVSSTWDGLVRHALLQSKAPMLQNGVCFT